MYHMPEWIKRTANYMWPLVPFKVSFSVAVEKLPMPELQFLNNESGKNFVWRMP